MPWHNLKGNAASYRPRRILFFDTETRPEQDPNDASRQYQLIRLGVAAFGRYAKGQLERRKERTFYDAAGFWHLVKELQSPRDTLWIVAHNLMFDMRIVQFETLFEHSEYVVDSPRAKRTRQAGKGIMSVGKPLAVLDNPPTIIGMRHVETGSRIVCVDSFNWFKESIKSLGKMVGLDKRTMPADSASEWEWYLYCLRDVEILERAFCSLLAWCDKHDCGVFRYSSAGQSMSAYRHRFMRHKIVIHDEADCKQLERESYFGGRADCFMVGKRTGKFYHLDVTSLYPSVMLNGLFPRRLRRWDMRPDFLALPPAIVPERSVAEVMIRSATDRYPVRINGRPHYVVGCFKCVLAGAELQYAVTCGHVTHWKRWAEYDVAPLFTDYVDYFWRLRQEYQAAGNDSMQSFAKMMLNTLYGKFGQLSPKWISVDDKIPPEPWSTWAELDLETHELSHYRSVGWHVQKCGDRAEIRQSFPAISSFVTSAGRERMRHLRNAAGNPNVYYQAVDSLIVNQAGYDNLIAADEIAAGTLGKLRLLRSADRLEVLGVGDYSLDDHTVMVGRRANAIIYADGSWTQAQFDGPGSLFKGTQRNHLCVQTIKKRRVNPWIAGTVGDDDIVLPYEINEPFPLESATAFCAAMIDNAAASIDAGMSAF